MCSSQSFLLPQAAPCSPLYTSPTSPAQAPSSPLPLHLPLHLHLPVPPDSPNSPDSVFAPSPTSSCTGSPSLGPASPLPVDSSSDEDEEEEEEGVEGAEAVESVEGVEGVEEREAKASSASTPDMYPDDLSDAWLSELTSTLDRLAAQALGAATAAAAASLPSSGESPTSSSPAATAPPSLEELARLRVAAARSGREQILSRCVRARSCRELCFDMLKALGGAFQALKHLMRNKPEKDEADWFSQTDVDRAGEQILGPHQVCERVAVVFAGSDGGGGGGGVVAFIILKLYCFTNGFYNC